MKTFLSRVFLLVTIVGSPTASFGYHLHLHGVPDVVITVLQPVGKASNRQANAKKRVYIEPRWVESTEGVLVLQPGYWTETETVRSKK